ncbi:MAG: hypothetical protein ABI873_00760 [Marmoricola sp.]
MKLDIGKISLKLDEGEITTRNGGSRSWAWPLALRPCPDGRSARCVRQSRSVAGNLRQIRMFTPRPSA